jgi:MFS family permease
VSQRKAITLFAVFAFAYFLSALIRAVTATLAPTLVQEFGLQARDLGLLAGGYFLGFAVTQLPLGNWLDRVGPRNVVIGFLTIAVLGCVVFAQAGSFSTLLVGRVLCGVGVSACLMAPLTGYRRWYAPASQMRANSWMLMVGSFGMVASTLPVQWFLPLWGWRVLFEVLAGLVVVSMLLIAWQVPKWSQATQEVAGGETDSVQPGYAQVWANPYFRRMAPLGFVNFGGLVAIQTLWASPWMVKVAGYSAAQAAEGLFWINVAMLGTFWLWGMVNPWLARRAISVNQQITYGMPLSFALLALLVFAGEALGSATAWVLAFFCVASTVAAQAQPCSGHGISQRTRWACVIRLQLGDLRGYFCRAVGHWVVGGCFARARPSGCCGLSRGHGGVWCVLHCGLRSFLTRKNAIMHPYTL